MENFKIGTYVTNCLASSGYEVLGIIRGYKAGSLILENPRIGRWLADPEKSKAYTPPIED